MKQSSYMYDVWYFLIYPILFHLLFNAGSDPLSLFHYVPVGHKQKFEHHSANQLLKIPGVLPTFEFPSGKPKKVRASCFGFDSAGRCVLNTLWILTPVLMEITGSLLSQTFEAVPHSTENKQNSKNQTLPQCGLLIFSFASY